MSKEYHPSLPNDICRCADRSCPLAESCLRYLLRSNLGDWTPIAATMREGEACDAHIPAEPGTWIRWRGGRQPVDDETRVQVEFDSQGEENDTRGLAKHFNWAHRNYDYWMNIVAFRVLKTE